MDLNRLDQQIRFVLELDKLKYVLRQNYLIGQDRQENTAEHCWHLAIMALLLAEYADSKINLGRVLELILIHDLVEIYAGDTYCYDEDQTVDQEEREAQAADRLFALLPMDQSTRLHELRNEFEEGSSMEARFAASLDRLLPLLMNHYSQGRLWKEHAITADQVLTRNRHIQAGSQSLWSFAQSIIEDSISKGYLTVKSDHD
ncbi:MAG: HD domain-containing protein [Anaerolineaceae bacterium]|nr:MAG: HD domain-containing protein [Anaerolineaceae bacterium]